MNDVPYNTGDKFVALALTRFVVEPLRGSTFIIPRHPGCAAMRRDPGLGCLTPSG